MFILTVTRKRDDNFTLENIKPLVYGKESGEPPLTFVKS